MNLSHKKITFKKVVGEAVEIVKIADEALISAANAIGGDDYAYGLSSDLTDAYHNANRLINDYFGSAHVGGEFNKKTGYIAACEALDQAEKAIKYAKVLLTHKIEDDEEEAEAKSYIKKYEELLISADAAIEKCN